MALTPHQSDIRGQILDNLSQSNRLVLSGSAGVGKTYLMDDLIHGPNGLVQLLGPYGSIYVTAPTHKALQVIRTKVNSNSRIQFKTIHAALGLNMKINYKTGKQELTRIERANYVSPVQSQNKQAKFIIVDEGSMVGDDLIKFIDEIAPTNCKVIFVGDNKQLNPVGEDDSPIFNQGYPEVELTEIIRQGEGNPIIDVSRNLNMLSRIGTINSKGEGYALTNNYDRIIGELARVNGTDEVKYIAWTNKAVDMVNNAVRNTIYQNPAKVEVGESIILSSPYGKGRFSTNQEITIENIDIVNGTIVNPRFLSPQDTPNELPSLPIRYYWINAQEGQEPTEALALRIIHEDSEETFNGILSFYRSAGRWAEMYQMKESCLDYKYNHALTVHRAQGSTFETTIMNYSDMCRNNNKKELKRLLYTAVTRSSRLLVVYIPKVG